MRAVKKHDAVSNATQLERWQDVRDRIAPRGESNVYPCRTRARGANRNSELL